MRKSRGRLQSFLSGTTQRSFNPFITNTTHSVGQRGSLAADFLSSSAFCWTQTLDKTISLMLVMRALHMNIKATA